MQAHPFPIRIQTATIPPTSSVAATSARADAFALIIRVSMVRVSFAFNLHPLQRSGESAYNRVLPAQAALRCASLSSRAGSAVTQE